jgi:hypothetical protein
MGSWANSLHVRADDARIVVEAIEELFLARGYKLSEAPVKTRVAPGELSRQDEALVAEITGQRGGRSSQHFKNGDARGRFGGNGFDGDFGESDFDDEFDEDFDVEGMDDEFEDGRFGVYGEFDDVESEGRSVCVFEPRAGWVGVMDSSLEGNIELARELSARLNTDTMLVMVNDSDSWYYWLHRDGVSFDEFDSAGGALDGDADEPSGEWLEAMENEDEEKLHQLLMSKAPQNIKFPSADIGLPFQMAALGAKVQSGQASFWERLKYRWLTAKFLFKLLTGGFSADKMDYGFDIPHTPLDDDALARHIERIKAFFPKAREQELRDLLPKCRFPSEDLLRKFLAIVGLPWFYAYLSFDYLEEHSERELAGHGIVQATELRFDPPGTAA